MVLDVGPKGARGCGVLLLRAVYERASLQGLQWDHENVPGGFW